MGFGFFIVAAGAAAGCYYGYRKLQQIEADIREELRVKGLAPDQDESAAPPTTLKTVTKVATPRVKKAEPASLEDQIISLVTANPGMLQTELYTHFSDSERKALQAELLKMDKAGSIKRSKEKSTYRLSLPG